VLQLGFLLLPLLPIAPDAVEPAERLIVSALAMVSRRLWKRGKGTEDEEEEEEGKK
jgi:hypothetical protein